MSWAVGTDLNRQRHIGYGVPATCDHPGCGNAIDRGLANACGGHGDTIGVEYCGLFFCATHLSWAEIANDDGPTVLANVCARCAADLPHFEPTPDTVEWVNHVTTDSSWEKWRTENPDWLERMRAGVTP